MVKPFYEQFFYRLYLAIHCIILISATGCTFHGTVKNLSQKSSDNLDLSVSFSNLPEPLSSERNYSVIVRGIDSQFYIYKYGNETDTDCQNLSGYSEPISIQTPIAIVVSSYTGNQALCALGVSSAGERQDVSGVAKYVWEVSWLPFIYIEKPGLSIISSTSASLMVHAPTQWKSMYLTTDSSCESGGSWQSISSPTPVTLIPDPASKIANIYAIFKDSQGKMSGCVNDSITVSAPLSVTTCSGTTNTDALTGEFIDSGGPSGDYSDSESCEVVISGGPKNFTFESLDIEDGYDFITVYKNATSPGTNVLLSATGNTVPPPVVSTSDINIIQFTSDGSATAPGYKVSWTSPAFSGSGSISIAAGSATTSSANVTLNIQYIGTFVEMYVTNDNSCAAGGSWRSVAQSLTWNLSPGNGQKTVYVKFRDPAALESACESDSILLYEGPPGLATLTGAPANNNGDDNLAVNVGGSEISSYKFKVGPAGGMDCTVATGYSSERSVSIQINSSLLSYGSGSYTLCVIGVNPIGVPQSLTTPTVHTWFRDVPLFVQLASSGETIVEGAVSVSFKFVANGIATLPVVIDYEVYGDFVATEGFTSAQATILAGTSEITVTLPITANPVMSTDRRISLGISNITSPHKQGLITTSSKQIIDAQRPAMGTLDIGYNTNCAVLSDGKLVCRDQVGGNTTSTTRFVEGFQQHVSSVTFAKVIVDQSHKCALTTAGELYCWGWGFDGQLGIGTNADHNYPQKINGFTWKKVVSSHSWNNVCGIDSNDDLYCWGDGTFSYGANGSGGTSDQRSPYNVDVANKYKEIVISGYSVCAITLTTNQLKCWGNNSGSRLGDGTSVNKLSPTIIDNGVGYNFVMFGGNYGQGITTTGEWKLWGSKIHSATWEVASTPESVDASRVYTALAGNSNLSCGLSNGYLYCIGNDYWDIMGFGTTITTPVLFDSTDQYSQLLAADGFICGITTTTNKLKCFGGGLSSNGSTTAASFVPALPTIWDEGTFSKIISVANGLCAVTTAGLPKCVFKNNSANGSQVYRETAVARLSDSTMNIRSVTKRYMVDESNRLYVWGSNVEGDYTFDRRTNPFRVFSSHAVSSISEKSSLTCFINTVGKLFCVGYNPGDSTSYAAVPVAVDSANNYLAVSVGGDYACAITSTNELKCWGGNASGQLGVGDTLERLVPTTVGTGYAKVSAAAAHACALKSSGDLYCWGQHSVGLGNGTTQASLPQNINPGDLFTEVVTGNSNCVIRTDNSRVMCWGSGVAIGNGSFSNRTALTLTSDTSAYQKLSAYTDWIYGSVCGQAGSDLKCWGNYKWPRTSSPNIVYTGTIKSFFADYTSLLIDSNGKLHYFGNTAGTPFGQQSYPKFETLMGLIDRVPPVAP